jgi:hypothetical protein
MKNMMNIREVVLVLALIAAGCTHVEPSGVKPPATRPVQDVRNFMIHGFKVGVTADHYLPVVASVFVDPSQFEDARRNEPQIRVVIESQLLGRQKEDVLDPKRSGEIENRIRTEIRGQIPNLTIDRIHLDLDIK